MKTINHPSTVHLLGRPSLGNSEQGTVKRHKRVEIVFFWKPNEENGWLSNWSPHSFTDADGVAFKTAEHYLMYHKALSMKDNASASKILSAKTPKEVKALGRKVTGFDEQIWASVRENIMFQALCLKTKAHPQVKRKLMATCGEIIAEASSYDTVWGIGCCKTSPNARNQDLWPGQNLLGKAWMKVRETLLDEDV